jgi:predicted TIM-barrel fold metal-dependent hydrolase
MKEVLALLAALMAHGFSSRPAFESFPKIDAHFHIQTAEPGFIEFAHKHNFRLMTPATGSASREKIDQQLAWARRQHQAFPGTVAYATTFSMEQWGDAGWQDKTLARLRQDFAEGAVAVKVWKDIGMTFREPGGRFILIDDPAFDPVFDFLAAEGKPVIGHLGEPRNCWLPLDAMTVPGDKSYFAEHPQYHMSLHPDYPSYEQQIAARDHLLEKHPTLRFVGAHLGSLEWDVDELAKRLDAYPNLAVDMAARICHLEIQDTDKVRRFILKYQDRLLYATDLSVGDGARDFGTILETWKNDWDYFAGDGEMTSPAVPRPFKGLALPISVLKKIYYQNAVDWLGGWKEGPGKSEPPGAPVPETDDSFAFAVMGDSRPGGFLAWVGQTVVDDARRFIFDKLAACNPAFVVDTGDFVKQGDNEEDWREFEEMRRVFQDNNIPYYPVRGNHEYKGDTTEALARFFEHFPALNGQLWYTLTFRGCGLIMLDSNFSQLSPEELASQKKWLEKTLSKYRNDGGISSVLVFFHHPPFTNSRYFRKYERVREYFVPILETSAKVKFVFSGHVHTYERFRNNGINYIVTGGGGSPLVSLPPAEKSRFKDEYDQTGSKPRGTHFCLVTVARDHIALKTLNFDPARLTWSAGDDYREDFLNK